MERYRLTGRLLQDRDWEYEASIYFNSVADLIFLEGAGWGAGSAALGR